MTKTLSLLLLTLITIPSFAQNNPKDSTRPHRANFFHNIFKKVRSSVVVSKQDSINKATVLSNKSVVPYQRYSGKVIRSITTLELGFEKVFTDTSQTFEYYGTKVLNALHTDTYSWVIRDNLFIREGQRLNPYMLADNERYLRTLEFIQDARILVRPVPGNTDSVDISIVTKDLFSISGSMSFSGIDRQRVRLAESNLAGAGQKIQATILHNGKRNPLYGYDVQYSKNSIAHSFVTGTVGYSKIASDYMGDENIESTYFQLERPLYSPYAHYAGAMQFAANHSVNVLGRPDSIFYRYRSNYFDIWGGYNISVNRIRENTKSRNRAFIALRYLRNDLLQKPFQLKEDFNSFFNNRNGFLGEITFFKQEFYKTNYVYGFGTTEDIPYGYNVALTSGWLTYNDLGRAYLGVNANRYVLFDKGQFMQYYLRTGSFIKNGNLEDATLLIGGALYSKIHVMNSVRMRHYIKASFTRLFNKRIADPLRINNELGLRYFNAYQVEGTQRLSAYYETFFFTKQKVLGFKFSPFGFVDASMLTPENKKLFRSDVYTGFGAGFRTRNVNLVFSTLELRFIYFPRPAGTMNPFKLSFHTDIRFRANSNYVKAPDIIQVNSEDVSSFY